MDKKKVKEISIIQLFRYSDAVDKLLLFFGTAFALIAGGIYPLLFLLYGRIAETYIELEKKKVDQFSTNFSCYNATQENINEFDNRITDTSQYYVIIGFVSLLANFLASFFWNISADRQIKRIREKVFESIVNQPILYFETISTGELNSIIINNVNSLQNGMNSKFADFIIFGSRGLGCVILVVSTTYIFAALLIPLLSVTVFSIILVKTTKKYTANENNCNGNLGKIAQEVFSSIRTIYSYGCESEEIQRYSDCLQEAERVVIKKGLLAGIFSGLSNSLSNVCFGLGLVYGIYLYQESHYEAGQIIQSFFAMMTSAFSIGQAFPFLRDLEMAKVSAQKVYQIIESKPVDTSKSGVKIAGLKGKIEYKSVAFKYPDGCQVFNSLSFLVKPGQSVAFVGESGCGKTTILKLLQQIYNYDGSITLDDKEIRSLDKDWFFSQISLVSQEPIMFTNSVKENIRLGRLNASDIDIENAAKEANVHEFIMSLPDKYDTKIGNQIASGEKQRIAIARALIRNPRILLLDEATSLLDEKSENVVMQALEKIKKNRTTIVIAHRLNTVKEADLIFVLNKGGIICEQGTHSELIQLKREYYKLTENQKKQANLSNEHETNVSKLSNKNAYNKDQNEQIESIKNLKTNKIWRLQRKELVYIIIGSFSQMVCGAIFPAISILFSEIYNIFNLPSAEQLERSFLYMGIMIAVSLSELICTVGQSYSFTLVGAKLVKRVRLSMFESLLKQEMSFHDLLENQPSILVSKLANDAPLLKGLTSDKLSVICQAFSGIGFSLILAFVLSWKLSLIMFIFVPVILISGKFSTVTQVSSNKNNKNPIEECSQLTSEVIDNIKTVSNLVLQDYFINNFKDIFNTKKKKRYLELSLRALCYGLSNSLIFFIQVTCFTFGYGLIKSCELTVSNLFKIYMPVTFSSIILGRVISNLADQQRAKLAAKSAFDIIERKSQIDASLLNGFIPRSCLGLIEFKDVSFRYPTRLAKEILSDFNLKINFSESIIISGESGAGKSTILLLLLRFYDVDQGEILLDKKNIKLYNVRWLRNQFGLVPQEPILFNKTIENNICLGGEKNQNCKPATVKAHVYDVIMNFQEGFDSLIGVNGINLSGGQRQRIAIARAFARQPKIYLFDEIQSALDSTTTEAIKKALENEIKNRTCLFISSKHDIIKNPEQIFELANGRLDEKIEFFQTFKF